MVDRTLLSWKILQILNFAHSVRHPHWRYFETDLRPERFCSATADHVCRSRPYRRFEHCFFARVGLQTSIWLSFLINSRALFSNRFLSQRHRWSPHRREGEVRRADQLSKAFRRVRSVRPVFCGIFISSAFLLSIRARFKAVLH